MYDGIIVLNPSPPLHMHTGACVHAHVYVHEDRFAFDVQEKQSTYQALNNRSFPSSSNISALRSHLIQLG